MKHLAQFIRAGQEAGIPESKGVWGIGHVVNRDGKVLALGIVGLALTGKIGLKRASEMLDAAQAEKENEGPAFYAVLDELRITFADCERLVNVHAKYTATEIATSMAISALLSTSA